MRVLAVVPGPEHHGAVRHAQQVAALVRVRGVDLQLSRTLRPGDGAGLTWVPFTDALFGPDVVGATEAFTAWADTVPGPLMVTLHDVPGDDPDPARDARRVAGYRRVVERADAVTVCSAHEAARVETLLGRPASTVPLPVEPLPEAGPRPLWAHRRTIGVLGFVYPGKGHDAALTAAASTGAAVVALGAVGTGSDVFYARLRQQADRLGVELLVTGPLSDPDLHAAALAVTVPFAAYTTRGASASLHTWLACGRRPVTTPGPYADELVTRWPGCVQLRRDSGAAVSEAIEDACGTWLTEPPPRPDVGAAYARLFASTASERVTA